MAYHNTVIFKGNMGTEARMNQTNQGKVFAAFSLATTDSYQNDNDEWIQKEVVWHNIITFNPFVIQLLKNLKAGSRIEVIGSLSYQEFHTADANGNLLTTQKGEPILKKEANIMAHKISLVPLTKKG